jgi:hypothetical protein
MIIWKMKITMKVKRIMKMIIQIRILRLINMSKTSNTHTKIIIDAWISLIENQLVVRVL